MKEKLIRQRKLEQLAASWAAAKKHEALGTNIFTYEKRVQAMVAVAVGLETKEMNNVQTLLKKH